MATTADIRVLGNYVGGRWVAASSAEQRDVQNPATGETLARVPLSNAADVDAAVRGRPGRAARVAVAPGDRARPLAVRPAPGARGPRRRARPLGHARDGQDPARRPRRGRPHDRDGRGRDAPCPRRCRAACSRTSPPTSTARRSASRSACAPPSCPFNFPAMVPFWFLPFAIACGNTFVLKPSEQVPLTQELVFNLIDDLGGLPAGVVNLVNGGGRRGERACSTIPASTPSRSSARPRSPSTSTSAPRPTASACRRWAAPRTSWWSCPTR